MDGGRLCLDFAILEQFDRACPGILRHSATATTQTGRQRVASHDRRKENSRPNCVGISAWGSESGVAAIVSGRIGAESKAGCQLSRPQAQGQERSSRHSGCGGYSAVEEKAFFFRGMWRGSDHLGMVQDGKQGGQCGRSSEMWPRHRASTARTHVTASVASPQRVGKTRLSPDALSSALSTRHCDFCRCPPVPWMRTM